MDKYQKKKYTNQKKIIRYSDIDQLLKRLKEETPAKGDYLFDYKLKDIQDDKDKLDQNQFTRKYKINFRDLPISQNTINGLSKRKFIKLSEIQRCSIPHALAGRDIMGASKTGSGKTLAYLVPIIERLYQQRWTQLDGLGALVILPTRELAMQVFEVLNSIGTFHELSVGLIIGGKDVQYEKDNIHSMNILIATPGRLLQHMDESIGFNAQNLQVLAVDEADMLFEMGFAETLNAVLDNLPKHRQTLLFSATLSKSVHQLGKLSLKEPEYIFLHDKNYLKSQDKSKNSDNKEEKTDGSKKQQLQDIYETPLKLMQYYMVVNCEDKLNCLFSFLKAHQKSKILVFFSTCKQVRFAFETFKKLKIGIPLMELHGRQKAPKRMSLFYNFTEKKYACLFTTNLAARGLDFPSVNWVVQVDCPDNIQTYVHRIGRTARFKQDGKSLAFFTENEEKFADKLKEKNIKLHKLLQNPQKQLSVTSTLQAFCSEDMDIKYLAQRAFISYMRSVYLNGDNDIHNVHKIKIKEFAESMGLIQTPLIKFKKQEEQTQQENSENSDNSEQEENEESGKKLSKLEKLKQKRLQERTERQKKKQNRIDVIHMKEEEQELEVEAFKAAKKAQPVQKHQKLQSRTTKIFDNNAESDSEEEFLTKKRKTSKELREEKRNQNEIQSSDEDEEEQNNNHNNKNKNKLPTITKRQLKKIKIDGHFGGANKLKITEDGKYLTPDDLKLREMEENRRRLEEEEQQAGDLSLKYALKKERNEELDKNILKQRLKEKAKKRKLKQIQREFESKGLLQETGEEQEVVLGGSSDEDED